MPGIGNAIGIPFKKGAGISWSAYWSSLISATVENAAPTNVVLTFPSAKTELGASDFTIAGFTVSSASWAGAVLTLTLAETVYYGESLIVTFVVTGGTAAVTNNVILAGEVTTYITGLATPLSTGQKTKLDRLVKTLKSGLSITDLDDVFDLFYVLAGETEESALKNLISNAYHCTNVSATSFTALEGFTGDGAADYLNTGFKPKTHGVRFGLNDASYGIYCRTNISSATVEFGARKAAADDRTFINLRSDANNTGYFINTDSATGTVANTNSIGLFVITREASNVSKAYKNGYLMQSNAIVSSDRPDFDIAILVLNSAGSLVGFSTQQLSIVFMGKNFSQSQILGIHTAIMEYLYADVEDILLYSTGYCWFNSPRALYNAAVNKTWIGIVHDDGSNYSQHIVTLDNATGIVTTVRVGTVNEYDDHNEPSILVKAADNKLFCAYSEHGLAGGVIRYRTSTNALDASAWGAEGTVDPSGANVYTYCNAFQVSNGDIYIFFRESQVGVDAWWNYIKSTDGGATFGDDIRFAHKDYVRCVQDSDDKDIIHFAISENPIFRTNPNPLCHVYFDASDESWHKSDGTDVTASLPLESANMTQIFSNADPEQLWTEDIYLDSNGYPRVLILYYPDYGATPGLKYLYYSEWNGSAWSTPYEIHQEVNRNMTGDAAEIAYSSLACFDRANANRIFASKDVDGVAEIFELTRVAANNFTSIQKTFNSQADQWRPFTVNNTSYNVFWLNKTSYPSYHTNFIQQLIGKTL